MLTLIHTPMFNNLTQFEYQRNSKQAIGFYLAYLFAIHIISAITIALINKFSLEFMPHESIMIGAIIGVLASTLLAFTVANSKGIFSQNKAILLIILAFLLSMLLGGFGGLIPIAYMTTLETSNPDVLTT